jgi:outer membrane protein OmpA-like peptidoglycan-associated protein
MKTRFLVPAFLLIASGIRASAQDLIANGSFQDLNVCKELQAPCSPSAWKTTSPHLMMYGAEKNGNYYARLTIFNSSIEGIRKYMQTRLLCPLRKDQVYIISVKLKPGNVFMGSFGIVLTGTPVFINNDLLLRIQPTIDLTGHYAKVPYGKRRDWYTITVEYRATGEERYLILGNFQDDAEQERTYLSQPKNFTDYEYYIDDVVLKPKIPQDPCRNYDIVKQQLYSQTERHPQRKFNMFGEDEPEQGGPVIDRPVDTLRLGNVYFEFDSDRLNLIGKAKLDSLFRNLVIEDIDSVRVCGHTDSMGPREYNVNLSSRRAEAIMQVIRDTELSGFVTEVKGYGDAMPIASNKTEAGRKKNRRVEVLIYYRTNDKKS